MTPPGFLASIPLWLIFTVTTVCILVAGEVGRRLGTTAAKVARPQLGALEGAILGLLALMISFTFSMALARFDDRRQAVLGEANAIGTTALRAQLLPAPLATEALGLLKEYTGLRFESVNEQDTAAAQRLIDRSNALQLKLWGVARRAAAADPSVVPTGLFIQTLNDTIDDQAKRLAYYRARVPDLVLLTLYVIAVAAIGFSGFAEGIANAGNSRPVRLMALIVALALWLIQDLDRPGSGLLQTDLQPLVDAAATLEQLTR
jgi:hypothetical protein